METTNGKKRANSAYTYTLLDGVHVWDYGALGKVKCNPDKGSAQARHFLLNYGIKQWVQDGGAVSADEGGKVDPALKFEGMRERAELIESGVDDLVRRGLAERGPASYVTRALVRMGKASDEAKANALVKKVADEKFGGEMKKAREFLAGARAVKEAINAIKAEEALKSANADADAYLEELAA